jgi:hydroxypyruvate reductase
MLTRRVLARELFDAAVAAVDPGPAVARALAAHGAPRSAPHIIAIGKAAPAMATAAVAELAAHGLEPAGGIVVAADGGHGEIGLLPRVVGDHPVPGPRSFEAARAIARAAAAVRADDECWVLLSGGTSSLIGAPAPGVGPEQLGTLFRELLASGRAIGDVNAVRRRMLRWGDGRLAEALAARHIRVLAISDVPGDRPGDIGSGPCSPEAEAREDGRITFEIVARNADAIMGAERRAHEYGLDVVVGAPLSGEASRTGDDLARELITMRAKLAPGRTACLIRGGETTVTLDGAVGTGGRSQELALAAARALAGVDGITALSAGTDGRDGPTDAAGAFVNGGTWAAIASAGLDPAEALAAHDSHRALEAAGGLLRTGPTGTNVMDLAIGVMEGG